MKQWLLFTAALCLCSAAFAQTWSKVGTGTNGAVHSLSVFDEGLIVGGNFTQLNGFERAHLAYIRENSNGSFNYFNTYSEHFNSNANSTITTGTGIYASAIFNGRVHIGGRFYHPAFAPQVGIGYLEADSETDTTAFFPYATLLDTLGHVKTMLGFDNKLFFGGDFTNADSAHFIGYIASNDYPEPVIQAAGTQLNGTVHCLAVYQDELYAGGEFVVADTNAVHISHIARWNGSDWEGLPGLFDGPVHAMTIHQNQLYVGGGFTDIDTMNVNSIAAFDGTQWSQLADGFTDSGTVVYALASYGDTLYAAGSFHQSGNTTTNNIAKWSGSAWEAMGTGMSDTVFCMTPYRGRLYIGGVFQVADALVVRNLVAYNDGTQSVSTPPVLSNPFRLYPNPALDRVYIETGNVSAAQVQLLDASGRRMLLQTLDTGAGSIPLHGIPVGYYIIHLHQDGLNTHQRLLIMH